MIYDYLALAIFAAFAIFVPASFVLTSKLLARRAAGDSTRNAPYESGEASIGNSRDVDNEYMPHFMLFLPFEMVVAILLTWSIATKSLGYYANVAILMVGFVATALAFFGYKLASG